jgi:hypothetical protein
MRSNGYVGIGQFAPTAPLTVNVALSGNIAAFSNNVDAGLNINLTSGISLLNTGTGTLAFGSGVSEQMRLSTNGNLLLNSTTDVGYKLDVNGTARVQGALTIKGYTVATLPTGSVGMLAYVTDATAPTYNGTLIGGGSVTVPVFYNGTAWVAH